MEFVTDKQTLDDLNILGRYKGNSIFNLFNHTVTNEGSRLLERMFQHPLTDVEAINERAAVLSFFADANVTLPFNGEDLEIVENYIQNPESKNRLISASKLLQRKFMNMLANDENYMLLQQGLEKTIEVFTKVKAFFEALEKESVNTSYHKKVVVILGFFKEKVPVKVWTKAELSSLSFAEMIGLDYIFRSLLQAEFEELLNHIYELDVFITVSKVAREKGFSFAKAVDKAEKYIELKDVYHPGLNTAIGNDIYIGSDQNVFFLTGANMAGKSTLMKSFAIAVYMAHMGFPVAASQMHFSLHDGIYTSINVPDNLTKGYSHFYAEVLRVKHVAQEVASNKQLVIIFDELFKGTNVKDAYDGTVAIVDAFSKRNGSFIVSTHITEAGEKLRETNQQLFFQYLPTVMEGNFPTYTYKLKDGITDDRHGMLIIKNEQILEAIKAE